MKNVNVVLNKNYEFLNSDEQEIITSLCGRNAIQITPADPKELYSVKVSVINSKNWEQLNVQTIS